MTHEERLDRLERIAKLMVRAGLRARRQSRAQDEKIYILIDRHVELEEFVAAQTKERARAEAVIQEKINLLIDRQINSEERIDRLAEAQGRSDERLDRLVETVDRYVSERRNGNP